MLYNIIGGMMKIDIVKVGRLRCNCYLLDIDGEVLVIDPGDEVNKIMNAIGNRLVIGIVITHHHNDHDGGVQELVNEYKTKVYDKNNLSEGINKIDKFTFEVIYTPGHKEDSICLYFRKEKGMFVGDFIFKDSIGRCDLPGGNIDNMFKSIEKIKQYDKDITIYPGHGEKTILGYEVNNNIYFLDKSKHMC